MLDALILSIIQGLTEFLPISSSAHLFLWAKWFSADPSQGLVIDVAAHFGALIAIVFHQRTLVFSLTQTSIKMLFHPLDVKNNSGQILKLIVATLPVVIVGGIFAHQIESLRSATLIGFTTLIFGVLLGISDLQTKNKVDKHLIIQSYLHALIIGVFQILALIPGVSRSGIVITSARFLGYSRSQSLNLAFLLAIPVLFAASVWGGYQLFFLPQIIFTKFLNVTLLSALSAYFCILFFTQWVQKFSFMPFVYYRIFLGLLILLFIDGFMA